MHLVPDTVFPSPLTHEVEQCVSYWDFTFKSLAKQHQITTNLLSESKIEEPLKDIACLDNTPFQDKFRFRERAALILERWSWRLGGYAKAPSFDGSSDIETSLPMLQSMLRARKRCTGDVGGISKVTVRAASGSCTSVPLPYS